MRTIFALAFLISTPAFGQEAPKTEEPSAAEPKECVATPAVTCPEEESAATDKAEEEPAPVEDKAEEEPAPADDLTLKDVRHAVVELSEEVRTEDVDTRKRERSLRKEFKALRVKLNVLTILVSNSCPESGDGAADAGEDEDHHHDEPAKTEEASTDVEAEDICKPGLVEKLEELTQRAQVVESYLNDLGAHIADNATGVAINRNAVASNATGVARNATGVASNATKLTNAERDIAGLRSDMTLLDDDMRQLLGRSFGITTGVCLDVSRGPGIPASAGFGGIGPVSLSAGLCSTVYWETSDGSGVEIFIQGGLNQDRGFEGGGAVIAYKRTGAIVIGGGVGAHGSSYDHWYQTGAGGTSNGVRLQSLVRWEPSRLSVTARPYVQFGQDTNTEKAAPAMKAGIVMSIAIKYPY